MNPQFADVHNVQQQEGTGIEFSPNPVTQGSCVATIVWPAPEVASYEVRDLLGKAVQTGTIRMFGGAEQERLSFHGLASGVYYFTVHGLHGTARAKLVIAH